MTQTKNNESNKMKIHRLNSILKRTLSLNLVSTPIKLWITLDASATLIASPRSPEKSSILSSVVGSVEVDHVFM